MQSSPITIAIDGPSGSGKSSASTAIARELGLAYLDTGAMYRALAWHCLQTGVDLGDAEAVARAAREFSLDISTDPADVSVRVGGVDVAEAIRETRISEKVSTVATNLAVREELRRRQREIIEVERDRVGGIVAEGRDITTVVAPEADHRILVTASEEARLSRRARELHGQAEAEHVEATRDQIVRRDRDDSTVSAFMDAADGVVTLDTSDLSLDEVVSTVLALVRGEAQAAAPHPAETGAVGTAPFPNIDHEERA